MAFGDRLQSATKQRVAELIVYDPSKMDGWIALRNSLGVAIALTIGLLTHRPVLGLVIGLGALNVAFADSREAYAQRLRRMLVSTGLCCLAVLLGSVSIYNVLVAGSLAVLWGFAAGMVVVLGTIVSELFTVSLTLFIICATQPVPLKTALWFALMTAVGGLVQILLSVSMWSLGRFRAERKALGILFRALADAALDIHDPAAAPFATEVLNQVHGAMASTLRSSSQQSDRYKFLLAQGERIRVSLHSLSEFREHQESHAVDEYLQTTRLILASIAKSLDGPRSREAMENEFTNLAAIMVQFKTWAQNPPEPGAAKMYEEAQRRIDALTGQLRAAVDVTAKLEDASWSAPEKIETLRPLSLQYGSALAALRANLNFKSVACRHATRLSVGVAVGEWLSHTLRVDRAYWIPMTIVLVLKPDYNATISRGLLRIIGTFAGILFSAVLFRYVSMPVEVEIIAAGGLMFLLRWIGTTNYGIFAFLISTLVVFLFAVQGIAPASVFVARSVNTGIGGAVALVLYLIWPTFEKVYIAQSHAVLLGYYRRYFAAIAKRIYAAPEPPTESARLSTIRIESRITRSNHEGSILRFTKEPGVPRKDVELIQSMQASSNRFIHAAMSLDAFTGEPLSTTEAARVQRFAHQVERTLTVLSRMLRTSRLTTLVLPDLRASFNALVARPGIPSGPIEVELDRMTNSLTTLTEQVQAWVQGHPLRKGRKAARRSVWGLLVLLVACLLGDHQVSAAPASLPEPAYTELLAAAPDQRLLAVVRCTGSDRVARGSRSERVVLHSVVIIAPPGGVATKSAVELTRFAQGPDPMVRGMTYLVAAVREEYAPAYTLVAALALAEVEAYAAFAAAFQELSRRSTSSNSVRPVRPQPSWPAAPLVHATARVEQGALVVRYTIANPGPEAVFVGDRTYSQATKSFEDDFALIERELTTGKLILRRDGFPATSAQNPLVQRVPGGGHAEGRIALPLLSATTDRGEPRATPWTVHRIALQLGWAPVRAVEAELGVPAEPVHRGGSELAAIGGRGAVMLKLLSVEIAVVPPITLR